MDWAQLSLRQLCEWEARVSALWGEAAAEGNRGSVEMASGDQALPSGDAVLPSGDAVLPTVLISVLAALPLVPALPAGLCGKDGSALWPQGWGQQGCNQHQNMYDWFEKERPEVSLCRGGSLIQLIFSRQQCLCVKTGYAGAEAEPSFPSSLTTTSPGHADAIFWVPGSSAAEATAKHCPGAPGGLINNSTAIHE